MLFCVFGKAGGTLSVILSAENVSRDFKISDQNNVHALKYINIEIEQGNLTVFRES